MSEERFPQPDADLPEEIAKKDLLRETGISYGQFYRWKRLGLIPEAWFRRRSTFTGQETFLPRRQVMERVGQIIELKAHYSFEEIAELLAPDSAERVCTPAELEAWQWASPRAHALLPLPPDAPVSFTHLLALLLADCLLSEGLAEGQVALAVGLLLERAAELSGEGERRLVVAERCGQAVAALHTGECLFDRGATVRTSVSIDALAEQARRRLREMSEERV
jgi:hypothetical protein